MKRILIVAAHPDDELLGIGGTIVKHVQRGDVVHSVVMCEGESLRYGESVGQYNAMKKAADILGVEDIKHLGFPDQRLDTFTLTDIIKPLEEVSEEFRPNIVYCQFGGDINIDHKLLFEAANVTFRPLNSWVEEFYAFYTLSSTEWAYPRTFEPNTWVDISDAIEKKIEAFSCYSSEIREYPHPRSIEAIRNAAGFWGNMCCMDRAEPFVLIRRMDRGR